MRVIRNLIEFGVLFLFWGIAQGLIISGWLGSGWLTAIIVALAWGKTAFFGAENLQELWHASRQHVAYHRFMVLMLINMSQIITSFALDYHCLHSVNAESFSNIQPALTRPELMFEYLYFSVLNFTFFGYGDITPQTIPAKLLTMTEIVLAFVTVIFLLSDFISLRESLSEDNDRPAGR